MNPVDMQNQAQMAALGGPGAPQGGPSAPAPAIPPELVQLAAALGLDINNPEDLAYLFQMIGAGGGGPMGPMAGSPPAGQGPAPMMGGPQGPPMPPM